VRRILLIGSPGSGKSTLARALGARFNLPVTHLDRLWWQPGWVELGHEKFRPLVEGLVAAEKWVIDGNYSAKWDLRMPSADTILWLDLPRHVCMRRVFRRAVTQLGRVRSDVASGCPERLDMEFFRYVWTFKAAHEGKKMDALRRYGRHARIVRLRSDEGIRRFISGI
jgi:adenylate kinase family enzyme